MCYYLFVFCARFEDSEEMCFFLNMFGWKKTHEKTNSSRQALLGPGGLLRNRAVLLASHSTAAAERAQRVLLLGSHGGLGWVEKGGGGWLVLVKDDQEDLERF